MFQVKKLDNESIVKNIYDTKETDAGVMMFLTFDYGRWFWVPAEDYVPIDY